MNLGLAVLAQRRLDEAAACQREALRLDPECADAQNNLGMVHYAQGHIAEAENCFRAALRLQPASRQRHAESRRRPPDLQPRRGSRRFVPPGPGAGRRPGARQEQPGPGADGAGPPRGSRTVLPRSPGTSPRLQGGPGQPCSGAADHGPAGGRLARIRSPLGGRGDGRAGTGAAPAALDRPAAERRDGPALCRTRVSATRCNSAATPRWSRPPVAGLCWWCRNRCAA